MSKSDTVSAKISPTMRKEINEYNVNISETIRKALRDEINRKKAEKLESKLKELKPVFDKISTETVVKMIREDRDQR